MFNLYFFHTSLHLSSARLLYNPLSLPIIPHDECSHFLSSYSSRLFLFFSLNFSPHHSFYPFSISHPFLSSLLQTISRIGYVSLTLPSVSIFPSLVFLSLSKISLSLSLINTPFVSPSLFLQVAFFPPSHSLLHPSLLHLHHYVPSPVNTSLLFNSSINI